MNIARGNSGLSRTVTQRLGLLLVGIILALASEEVRYLPSWLALVVWLGWVSALAIYFEYKGRK